MCPKDADWMANSVDPDQNDAEHGLLRPVCLKTKDHYSKKNAPQSLQIVIKLRKSFFFHFSCNERQI